MIEMTGGEALHAALRPEGVRFVLGVPGGKLGAFMKAVSLDPAMVFLGTRHEAAAAHMAAAIHAGMGGIAVAMAEAGPGGAYLASGVAQAFNNNLAMLAITSNNQQSASYPGRGMFMEQDNLSLFRPITKWNAAVHDGRRLPELVREAFRQALSGRPGPVHLDIPQDVLSGRFAYDPAPFGWAPERYRPTGRPRGDAQLVARAAALLAGAERPLLIAGGGVVRSGAAEAFRRLGARLGAAMTATQMGIGSVAADAAGFIGHGGVIGGPAVTEGLKGADVVLALGCRFSSWLWDGDGALVRPPQRLIQVDLDPAMIGRAAATEIGIVGDAGAVLEDLLAALGDPPPPAGRAAWVAGLEASLARHRAVLADLAAQPGAPMHPAALAAAIGAALPADALAVYDGGHASFWSNDLTPVAEPATRFHDPGLCQLGFGLPYALALKAARPERPVFLLTGDGSFGFAAAELDTARRHRLPVVSIIHNNAAWGVIGLSQKRQNFALGCDLDGTDYAAIARGFGCHGEIVTSPDAVAPAIRRALESGLPAVLDCRVRFEPHPCMPAFGRMGGYGMAGH